MDTNIAMDEDLEVVKPESDAWKTIQLWKEEIFAPGRYRFFDQSVPEYLGNTGIQTVQDMKDKWTDKGWMDAFYGCGVNKNEFLKKLEAVFVRTHDAIPKDRMVTILYDITDCELSQKIDLNALRTRVEETFDWYNQRRPPTFVAPYFPFIQSSGMGKTKLLYELRKMLNKEEDTTCYLCLSGDIYIDQEDWEPKNKTRVFNHIFNFQNQFEMTHRYDEKNAENVAKNILQHLDNCFRGFKLKRLVLLFDEAHVLLEKHFEIEAFVLQCITLWLRGASRNFECVGVFAGTTLKLANYRFVNIFSSNDYYVSISSRDVKRYTFKPPGERLPVPFHQTTTIGCCLRTTKSNRESATAATDYDRAVPYGRPLFAKMAEHFHLENRMCIILGRMLLSNVISYGEKWTDTPESCLSILATRVQMGQTSMKTATELVSGGYVNLTGFSGLSGVRICCQTDPVCARLAMALMDENWSMKVKIDDVNGMPKRWWVEQALKAFSSGLCRPEKENAGEVFAALYLLFCGDLLRKEIDPSYRHFSVPLDRWVSNLISQSFESMEESTENLYESGNAFFANRIYEDFDIVAPIRYFYDGHVRYAPLLVSVQACEASCVGPGGHNRYIRGVY
jgi:hypothetical protein